MKQTKKNCGYEDKLIFFLFYYINVFLICMYRNSYVWVYIICVQWEVLEVMYPSSHEKTTDKINSLYILQNCQCHRRPRKIKEPFQLKTNEN